MFVTAILVSAVAILGNLTTAGLERRVIFTNCLFVCLTLGLSYFVGHPAWLAYDLLAPLHQAFDPVGKLIDRWA